MIRSRLAREKAHNILSMYNLSVPPIDVIKIAENLGFKVIEFDFPETMDAVIRILDGKKVIAVNRNKPKVRQRFSVAHELGHYLSGHDNFSHDQGRIVEYKDKKYLDPHHREEEEADEFAAELLMPESMVRKDILESKLETKDLAKRYNVSEQAMWVQLINLKLASEQSKV